MAKEKQKSKLWSGIKIILLVILMVIIALATYLTMSSIKEWKPSPIENAVSYKGENTLKSHPKLGKEYSILTYNVGYGSLGKESDFFLDGGKMALPANKDWTKKNLKGLQKTVKEKNKDFVMLQEVDTDAKRSSYIDEREVFNKALKENASFAYNFRAAYIPYPFGEFTGRVNAGLYTASKYPMDGGKRIALTVPFKWPERIFNLKRCLLVNRVKLDGTDKELVMINLHLEAYDKNGGRKAQTKKLMQFAEKEYKKGNYVIAGGDWNQALVMKGKHVKFPGKGMWKPEEFKMDKALKDSGWKINYGMETSTSRLCNQPYIEGDPNNYYYIIDGFMTSPNIEVKNVKSLDEKYEFSDHNPVEMKFVLKENK